MTSETTFSRPRHLARRLGVVAAIAVAAVGGAVIETPRLQAVSGAVASSVVTVEPTRVLDTRFGTGLTGDFTANESRKLQITGSIPTREGGANVDADVVPSGATGVLLNVTALRPQADGFISIRPGDASGEPSASNLNFSAGAVIPNAVTVALPTSGTNAGQIDIWYGSGTGGATTGVLADIVGYTVEATGGGTAGPPGPEGPEGPEGPPGADGASFEHIIVVPGNDVDTANGAALRAALAAAEAREPTEDAAWVIFLEPGTYDLGTAETTVDDYVHIRGSGQAATIIEGSRRAGSTAGAAVLNFNDGSEISDLTVVNNSSGASGNFSVGIYVNPSDRLEARRITVEYDTTGFAPNPIGINGGSNSRLLLEDATVSITSTGSARGVAPPSATASTASDYTIRRSTLIAVGGFISAAPAAMNAGVVTIEHSTLDGSGAGQAFSRATVGTATITHSILLGGVSSTGSNLTCLATTTDTAFFTDTCPT